MAIRVLSHFGVADAAGALVDVHAIHYGRLVSPLQTDVDSVVARDDGRLRDSIRDKQDEQTAHASAVEQLKQEQQEHASAVEQLSKEQQEHASAVEQLRTAQQEHVSAVERLQNVLLEDVLKKEYELLANALAGWKVTLEYCNRMMEDNDSYIEAGGRQIPLFDPYAHDEDRYETREKLSRTGRVFKAHSNLNSRVVAIKLYPLLKDSTRAAGGDWRMPERMGREVVALRRISESVKFVDFVDLIQVSQRIGAANKLQGGVVMPLYPADLDAIIYQLEKPLMHQMIIFYGRQILRGLQYLHARGVLHPNLRPSGLFLDPDHVIKITGLDQPESTRQNPSQRQILPGSVDYRASEVAFRGILRNERTDIWSFAVILLEMLKRGLPWANGTAVAVFESILRFTGAPHNQPLFPGSQNLPGVFAGSDDDARVQPLRSGRTTFPASACGMPACIDIEGPASVESGKLASVITDCLKLELNARPTTNDLLKRPVFAVDPKPTLPLLDAPRRSKDVKHKTRSDRRGPRSYSA
ncbi:hypothetical protein OC845_005986 [Tilletia horrida]|nr:hypothetical protein OC845_005986 [Tilletia horrida]